MTNKSTRTPSEVTQIAVMANDLAYARKDLAEIKQQLNSNFVPLSRYILVEKLVFGLVGLILVSVMGGIMAIVIRR